jgi:hypothetical protein
VLELRAMNHHAWLDMGIFKVIINYDQGCDSLTYTLPRL